MAKILRPRRGKRAFAQSQNIVLAKGEMFLGYDRDNPGNGPGYIYVGDGSTSFSSLQPFITDPSLATVSHATNADTATYATSAGSAGSAASATSATNAATANFASNVASSSLPNSGATAGSYGPSAAVSGTDGTTMPVPYITVDAKGRVTAISNKTYTSKDTNTDTKVTAVGNHYTPTTNNASSVSKSATGGSDATWGTTQLVTGVTLKRDAAYHVTGLEVSSIKLPSNPNTDTKVTSAANHYTPAAASTVSGIAFGGSDATPGTTQLVTGVDVVIDSKGHVTSVGVDSVKLPTYPSYAAGTGLSLSGSSFSLATTGTAGTYGPSANVTGNDGATISVPQITTDSYGRVTSVTNRTYTSKNTTYAAATTASAGLLAKLNGNEDYYYTGIGTWRDRNAGQSVRNAYNITTGNTTNSSSKVANWTRMTGHDEVITVAENHLYLITGDIDVWYGTYSGEKYGYLSFGIANVNQSTITNEAITSPLINPPLARAGFTRYNVCKYVTLLAGPQRLYYTKNFDASVATTVTAKLRIVDVANYGGITTS